MAPTGIINKLKAYYSGEEAKVVPPISVPAAAALLVLYTVFYVAPFYVSATTRPSKQLSRDAPSVIRGRITSVTWSCVMCSIFTFVILSSVENGSPLRSLHIMGYFPVGFVEAFKALLLTALLFLGPLFEAGIAEGGWREWIRLQGLRDLFSSWIGYRNIIAGPITEEVLFRSCSVPLFVIARASLPTMVFGTPIIFGLAHIHHFYEFRLTHPHTSLSSALLRSAFQFTYTSLFGSYATFLYLRTGSILAVILVHAFCNCMGLPRVWGRLSGAPETLIGPDDIQDLPRKKDDHVGVKDQASEPKRLGVLWTFAYYILLVSGAVGWYKLLWVLTKSEVALTTFKSS